MKKLLALVLAALMALAMVPAYAEATFTPGTYSAAAQGFGGNVTVTMTFDEENVTDVKIDAPDETSEVGGVAAERLAEIVKSANGSEFDAVSGASITSAAVKSAVADCLAQAKGEEVQVASAKMQPGTYTGKGTGMFDEIHVSVTVDESSITSVEVTQCNDTQYLSGYAIEEIPKKIVEAQSVAVDATTGATVSSRGILMAVRDALAQAGAAPEQFNVPVAHEIKELPDENYDIVVVGAGGAGLSAANQARRDGDYSVLLLERNAMVGGTTAMSGGGISAGSAKVVLENGYAAYTGQELADFFVAHRAGLDYVPDDVQINATLVKRIGDRSSEYLQYLLDEGIPGTVGTAHYFDEENNRGTSMLHATVSGPETWAIWYSDFVRKNGVEIRTNAEVTELVTEGNAVVGVKVKTPDSTYTVRAKKVILTCGGFARNEEMREKYFSDYKNIDKVWPLCTSGAVGTAIKLVEPLDGALAGYGPHIDLAIGMPYGTSAPYWGVENWAQYAVNMILCSVNQDGETCGDPRNVEYNRAVQLLNQEGGTGYAISSASSKLRYYGGDEVMPMSEYAKVMTDMGRCVQADTLEELADKIGADPAMLKASVDSFNELARSGATAYYEYPIDPVEEVGPYYAFKLDVCILGTFFGVKLDDDFRVMNNSDEAIPNLFAAGECANGNWMVGEYPTGSMAVTCAVYGGTIAADEAIEEISAGK